MEMYVHQHAWMYASIHAFMHQSSSSSSSSSFFFFFIVLFLSARRRVQLLHDHLM
jgi:hypothetical protein